jgi:hypothetical protein
MPDVDERVSLALGRVGRYTDDYGFLDPGRAFGAFSDEEEPLVKVGERARSYFGYLLSRRQEHRPQSDVLLILPAVTLAALDRPFLAHRLARQMRELIGLAWDRDAKAVRALFERTTNDGPLVFAAAARINKGLRLLVLQDRGVIDDDDVVRELMRTYHEAAESAFGTLAWLALDLDRVAKGDAIDTNTQPPTLGVVEQQLAAAVHPLAGALAASSDSLLRNAAGHSQYR